MADRETTACNRTVTCFHDIALRKLRLRDSLDGDGRNLDRNLKTVTFSYRNRDIRLVLAAMNDTCTREERTECNPEYVG